MLNIRSWNLTLKFILTLAVVVTGVGFTIGGIVIYQNWKLFNEEFTEKSLLLSHSVAVTAPSGILRNDYWFLYQSLSQMAEQSILDAGKTKVITGMILDPKGIVLAHLQPLEHPLGLPYDSEDSEEKRLLTLALKTREPTTLNGGYFPTKAFLEGVIPLFSDEIYIGVVRVRISKVELYIKAKDTAQTVLLVTIVLTLLGTGFGVMISQSIVKPLTAITGGLEAIARGELTDLPPITTQDTDELGQLAITFNKMTAELIEKKALEDEIAVSEKLVALGRISAGVAHEVNNPLAGILNCIDTLKTHPDNPELTKRYLPIIEKGLHRIRDIVQSLLIELKVEESATPQSVSCIETVRELISAEIEGQDIKLVWENSIEKEVLIPGNRIQQIILNLLRNSIQALEGHGTIVFKSFKYGEYLVFQTSDDGPGIPPEHKKQLFDPFFTTKPSGTGLGLWIVYRLVESMHGVIEMETELEKGTMFRVTVPLVENQASK